MLQLIYELRKNCCGRVDGTGGRNIEGSTRGPRGPKKTNEFCTYMQGVRLAVFSIADSVLAVLEQSQNILQDSVLRYRDDLCPFLEDEPSAKKR